MKDWEFSSFREYCNLSMESCCNQQLLNSFTDIKKTDFYKLSYALIPESDIEAIL